MRCKWTEKLQDKANVSSLQSVWIPRLCCGNGKLPHLPGDPVGDWFPVPRSPHLFLPSLILSLPPQWRWPVLGLVLRGRVVQRTTCCSCRSLGKGRELLNLSLVVNGSVIRRKIEMCSKMRVSKKHFFFFLATLKFFTSTTQMSWGQKLSFSHFCAENKCVKPFCSFSFDHLKFLCEFKYRDREILLHFWAIVTMSLFVQ